MNSKLTITIDEELIRKAKQYAHRNGVSLSQLVEDALRNLSIGESPSFSQKWRGRFVPAEEDSPRYKVLAGRYL